MPEKIIIGVDARPLTNSISGVSRVIFEILSNIQNKSDYEFVLFANKECHADFQDLLEQSHIRWDTGQGFWAKKAGLYFNIDLPFIIRKKYKMMQLFWGSQQVIPPYLPKNIKVVLTYYDLVLYFFPGSMRWLARLQQKAVQKMSIKRADHILSISKQTQDDMIQKFKYPPAKSTVSLLGYNMTKFRQKDVNSVLSKSGFDIRKKFLLAVSTIEPRKNYTTLINAWFAYHQENKNPMPLLIAGRRGWESQNFYERLDLVQKQSNGNLFILEGLSDPEISTLYAHCSFFCMASLYEGFGLPLLEALSHKKTAIVSDIPCFHEIGQNYTRYVPALDTHSWQKAISEISDCLGTQKTKPLQSYFKKNHLKDPAGFDVRMWSWKNTSRLHTEIFQKTLGA